MKDLDFFIKINIDHKEAKVNLASLKESFSSFVKEVKKPLGQIESFIRLKKETKNTEADGHLFHLMLKKKQLFLIAMYLIF